MNTVRFWILKKLFTYDEKCLIMEAIESRVSTIEIVLVTQKWADVDNIL